MKLRHKQTDVQQNHELSQLQWHLLNDFQRDWPLVSRPFAWIAKQLSHTQTLSLADSGNLSEQTVINSFKQLLAQNKISRIGPVFSPNRVGVSLLAAMALPAARLLRVAEFVSSYDEVNHNYEREHFYNLWFVITANNQARLQQIIEEITTLTGFAILELPMLEAYHIDLGFKLDCV